MTEVVAPKPAPYRESGASGAVRAARAARVCVRWFCASLLKFSMQYGRLISALVRPVALAGCFAAGFRKRIRVSIVPPYDTYISYDVYIAPGLIGHGPAVQTACSPRWQWSTTARWA